MSRKYTETEIFTVWKKKKESEEINLGVETDIFRALGMNKVRKTSLDISYLCNRKHTQTHKHTDTYTHCLHAWNQTCTRCSLWNRVRNKELVLVCEWQHSRALRQDVQPCKYVCFSLLLDEQVTKTQDTAGENNGGSLTLTLSSFIYYRYFIVLREPGRYVLSDAPQPIFIQPQAALLRRCPLAVPMSYLFISSRCQETQTAFW